MKRKVFSVLTGAVCGSISVTMLVLLFSLIIVKSGSLNQSLVLMLCIIAAALGMFAGGFLAAKIADSMGLLIGALSGAAGFLILLAVNAVSGTVPDAVSLLRFAVMLIAGAAGGVIGVNGGRKKQRKRRKR